MTKTFILFFLSLIPFSLQAQKLKAPEIGVVENIENDSILHLFGYKCLVESTSKILSPRNVSDQQFKSNLKRIKKSRIPLFACNIFIPGDLKVVGPDVNEEGVLSYVDIVFKRAKAAGLRMIIWGSGGSRAVPNEFDHQKAKAQFISMGKKIAVLAEKYKITVALESLNSTECNFINTLKEALEVVKAVDHKNLRLCMDIYHMLKEGESSIVISEAKGYLVYCEVAEKEGRTPPGVHGEDFSTYFTALKNIGYTGKIVLECRWSDLNSQGASAYQELRRQIDKAYQ